MKQPLYFVGNDANNSNVKRHPAESFNGFTDSLNDIPFKLSLTRAEYQAMDKPEQGKIKVKTPYFVPCTFKKSPWYGRTKLNAGPCNLICLDLDDSGEARRIIKNPEILRALGFSFYAYHTISSTPEKPRIRIIIEADGIHPERYESAVRTVIRLLGIKKFDPKSESSVQPMFVPVIFADEDEILEGWYIDRLISRPLALSDIEEVQETEAAKVHAPIATGELGDDSLNHLPVTEVTETDARHALAHLDADMVYGDWINTGFSLKHQFREDGFDLYNEWSAGGSKYEGTEATRKKWNDFDDVVKPRTIRCLFQDAIAAGWDGVLERGDKWLPMGGTLAAATLVPPVPLSASLAPVTPFDPAWLPAPFRLWIADVSERMQCPPEYPAIAALTVLSSVVGRRLCIQPKQHDEGFVEFVNIWGMIIGPPSMMKSPAMQAALRPLRAMESAAFKAYEGMEHDRKAAEIEAKIKRSNLESEAKKAAKAGEPFDYASLIVEDGESSPCRRFIVNNASIEALGEVLKVNQTGTLLYQDELAGLLAMLDKDGNQDLRTFLLQAWSGKEGFTFDRIGRGTRRIEACALSVLGSIQPGVIAHHVLAANGTSAGADGFMQRFSLMVWPDINPNWKYIDRPLDRKAEAAAAQVFQVLENITPDELLRTGASAGRDGIPTFQFAPDAQPRFNAWLERLELRLRGGGTTAAFEAHLGKYRKLVPALAMLIHIAERQPGSVTMSALERAISMADCLESHAMRVYGSGVMAECDAAKALLQKLRAGETGLPDKFTAREVKRKGWAHLTRPEEVEAACELLVDHHWLLTTPQPTTGTGGRPTMLYTLNPLAKKPECPR